MKRLVLCINFFAIQYHYLNDKLGGAFMDCLNSNCRFNRLQTKSIIEGGKTLIIERHINPTYRTRIILRNGRDLLYRGVKNSIP